MTASTPLPPNPVPVLSPKDSIKSPDEYQSLNGAVKVTVDDKFIKIDLDRMLADHVGSFRNSNRIVIQFRKDGKGVPDTTGYSK